MPTKHRLSAPASRAAAVLDEVQAPAPSDELTDAEIALRAYSYWEARGFHGGSADADWLRAVEELRQERERR